MATATEKGTGKKAAADENGKVVVAEQANELRAEHGLPADPDLQMLHRYLVLVPFPPSFRDPGFPLPPTAHALRHVSPDLPLDESELRWLAALTDKELVYVTLGTIFNQESGDLFERIVEGVRDLPIDVVATVGRGLDPEVLGPQPPNVHVERYIPQAQLLPRPVTWYEPGRAGPGRSRGRCRGRSTG